MDEQPTSCPQCGGDELVMITSWEDVRHRYLCMSCSTQFEGEPNNPADVERSKAECTAMLKRFGLEFGDKRTEPNS